VPEGPSLVILKEETARFVGQQIVDASGNTTAIDPADMVGEPILSLRTWGKHFLIELPAIALRIHFLLFGTYRVNERREGKTPRLSLTTASGDELNFYACIKNEVLFRIRVHPCSKVGALPPAKLRALVEQARQYSFDFLGWKKDYVLKKHWLAHAKTVCPRCNMPYTKAHLGRSKRRSFFCERCQKRYDSPEPTPFPPNCNI
jgi:endonuclease-8